MLDIGWSEILLIAVVAIVVIGPKDLPGALRALGAGVARVRRMAGEFQGQFNEALREANLEDVKRELDTLRQSTSVLRGAFNPVGMVRDELRSSITGSSAVPAVGATTQVAESTTSAVGLTSRAPDSPSPAGEGVAPIAPDELIPSAFAPLAAFKRG